MHPNTQFRKTWLIITLVVLLSTSVVSPVLAQTQQIVHTVQPGENLFRIALYYGTTVDAIVAANGLLNVYIYVGQRLVIPNPAVTEPPDKPLTPPGVGDTSEPDAPEPEPDVNARAYIIQPGDVLLIVSARLAIPSWQLLHHNGLTNTRVIQGQQLLIPEETVASQPEPEITPTALDPTPTPVPTVAVDESDLDPTPTPAPTLAEEDPTPEPTTEPVAPTPVPETYTVQPGDTMFAIASRFGTTPLALAQLNGIANPSQIYIGQELRLTGTAPVPVTTTGGKLIEVNLSEQKMYVYQEQQVINIFWISSGKAPYYTRTGEFRVQSKFPRAWGSTWNIWMPSWLGIYWAGSTENGIHALPETTWGQVLWAQYLGQPRSFGCIVVDTQNAAWLYEWAEIGTPVSIHY